MESLPRWDLRPIYPGPESAEFLADLEWVRTNITNLGTNLDDGTSDLQANIEAFELLLDYAENLGAYTNALVTTDTTNSVYLKALNQVEDLLVTLKPLIVRFLRHLAARKDEIKERGSDDPYAYVLESLLIEQEHLMSDELEEFAADLGRSSWDAFTRLQQSLGSSISTEWEEGEIKTVVELRNMATDPDRSIRAKAFEKELELLEIHEEGFAAALNGVKGATLSLTKRRGWASPLDHSIFESRIDSEILGSLIASLEEAIPLFRRYLKKKADLLGVEKLAFYDLFAPVAKVAKPYTYAEARAFIVEHFSRFSEEMGKFADHAFEHHWIDPEPRKGKIGGAYDTSFPVAKQSRILSNFDYRYSGVSTLAHELGHAYHDSRVLQHSGLLRSYPMPLAETASIFCEGLIFQGALEDADEEERIALIEAMLQDSTQVCLDILSRYYFEE
ncbi:MAG: M3 family metallopeptidase, partial [Sphaerochaeta sp.]